MTKLTETAIEELLADDPPAPAEPVHVMTDLETWGQGNNAVPVSLGACKFTGTEIVDKFHVGIDPVSCEALGLKIDAETILWWFDPARDAARRAWLNLEKTDLASALVGFASWLGDGPEVKAIWGNGSTFDNVILRSAYEAAGLEYPVRFWQDQCYRTLKYRVPDVKIVREGTHHDALDDAVSQAKHLQAIMKALRAPIVHLEALQDVARKYIEPGSDDVDEFVTKIIELLDGPEQREAMAARTML